MFLRGSPPPNVAGIISIHGRREFGVEAEVPHRLDLAFDDAEVAADGDFMAMQRALSRKRWNEQNNLVEVPPTREDAAAIIAFAREVRSADGTVLCHCGGGMSRAPAAALICLATWRGPGAEAESVADILRLRRGAIPHGGLVRFGDELLRRDGALPQALANAQS